MQRLAEMIEREHTHAIKKRAIERARQRRRRRVRCICTVVIVICLIALAVCAGYYFGYVHGYRIGRVSRIPEVGTTQETIITEAKPINL
jgi:uncharacterized membrane protein